LGRRADGQAIEIADHLRELLLVRPELGLEVDRNPAILEDLHGGGRERIGDENVGRHGCFGFCYFQVFRKRAISGASGCDQSGTCLLDAGWPAGMVGEDQAAFGSASFLLAKAQSSHSVSASTSARSTVEPHQMRRPGGASR